MGNFYTMMTYYISLSENLAQGQAGPSGLNDHVGTSLQPGDCGAGGQQTEGTLPHSRASFPPLCGCKDKDVYSGYLLQIFGDG